MGNTSTVVKGNGRLFYGWIIVAACFFIATITFGAAFSFGVFLNPFRESFGWTSAAVSGAYSLCLLVYTSFGIVAGWGTDKYGPKKTAILGGLLLGLGLLLTSRVNSLWQLYTSYALIGIGISPAYAPLMTTVSRWFVKRRGLALGIISAGIGAGPLIMAPLASYLISTSGWRSAFLVMAATAGLIVIAAFLLKRSPEEIGEFANGEMYHGSTPEPKTKVSKVTPELSEFSFREAIGTRAFWLLGSMNLTVGIGLLIVITHIVAYSESQGISPITAATVLSIISGASIAGRVIMGMASDSIGRKKVFIICVSIEGLMLLWLIVASSVWTLFLFAAVFGFCFGGHAPQFPALTGETLGLGHMGTILGAVAFFWGAGGALGSILAGYIFDTTGSYTSAFVIGAAAMFLTAAITLFLKSPEKEKR